MVFGIYRWKHFVGKPVCNKHREQYYGEEEQFSWSIKFIE